MLDLSHLSPITIVNLIKFVFVTAKSPCSISWGKTQAALKAVQKPSAEVQKCILAKMVQEQFLY